MGLLMNFDWSDYAFGSKKSLRELKATFIVAPRTISEARLKQLVKQHLSDGNIILGIAKEPFVLGFEGQPQFKMLAKAVAKPIVDKVAASASRHKLYTLSYAQSDLRHILAKPTFKKIVLVNGSWKYTFHTQPPFYALVQSGMPFEYASAFVDEAEAKEFVKNAAKEMVEPAWKREGIYSDAELMEIAGKVASRSYDYSYQAGAVLARRSKGAYQLLAWEHNNVVPFETYAMLHGASREKNFSPPFDQNFYDTAHAETMLLIRAVEQQISLNGCSVFINLLPCPTCARILSQTSISELVYREDHSDGYAVKILELSGKIVRRFA